MYRGRLCASMAVALAAPAVFAFMAAAPVEAQEDGGAPALPESWVNQLQWRSIGPANMSGRITDIAVYEADKNIWWAATASGGLLKTTNNGVTFEHQFDGEATVSIGDIAVAQSNPDIVWVGTGEANPRNSVSWGDGVYKSTDGGKTWKNMGLRDSYQIGRIVIHPTDPNIVYVGALGRLWGPNEERGLFKTNDGGETWEKILFIDDKTGVVDVQMHPKKPDTLMVATYERQRDGFDTNDPAKKWGPGGGIYRTTDGGKTFTKLAEGLPTSDLGRICIQYAHSDPDTVYAIVECERIGMEPEDAAYAGLNGQDADVGARLTEVTEDGPAAKAGLKPGDIIFSVDGEAVHSYDDLQTQIRMRLAGDTVRIEASRNRESVFFDLTFERRPEPERQARRGRRAAEQEEAPEAEPAEQPEAEVTGEGEAEPAETEEAAEAEEAAEEEGVEEEAAGDEEEVAEGEAAVEEEAEAEPEGAEAEAETEQPEEPAAEAEAEAEEESEEPVATEEEEEEEEDRPRPFGTRLGGQRENFQDQQGPHGHEYGGVYKSTDGGDTWVRVNSVNPRPMYFSQLRVDPSDDQYMYVLGIQLYRSSDGGETFSADGDGNSDVHVDHHAMWIDPEDGRHIILGNDGGIYVTYDRMEHWDHLNHVAIGQFYHVTVSPDRDYRVYGGLQDNGSWGGPHRSRSGGGPVNSDWELLGWGDGFVCRVDREDPDQVYFESQNGGMGRYNFRTGERGWIRPRPQRGERYRFNWKTPFILSNHNSRIFYTAGNHVFRSLDRGESLRAISPEITLTDRGSGTALAESPRDPDVLYVGTDDGTLWMTRNGGHEWIDLFDLPSEEEAEAAEGEAAEEPAERGGGRFGSMIDRFDANDDGKLQRSEAPERMAGFFDRLDTNDDDVIDAEEMSAGRFGRGERGGEAASRFGGRRPGAEGAGQPRRQEEAAAADDPITGHWIATSEFMRDIEISMDLKLGEGNTITGRIEAPNTSGDVTDGVFNPDTGDIEFTYRAGEFEVQYTGKLEGGVIKGEGAMGDRFQFEWEATRESPEAAAETESESDTRPMSEFMPTRMWVSSIEASRYEDGRVYVTFDGHRSDDDLPYVFVSEDFGETWRSINANLPDTAGSSRVLREDIENPDVLYLGCEFGLWVSIDRGENWTKFNSNLPTVAIHEVAQHPTCGDIVAGTHGRSLWILDATPVRQMSREVVNDDMFLFKPNDVVRWREELPRGPSGTRRFIGANPPEGARIFYSIGEEANRARITITDLAGETIRELDVDNSPGLHRVNWDLRHDLPDDDDSGRRRWRRAQMASTGTYKVTLRVDDQTMTKEFEIQADPKYPELSVTEETDALLRWAESFGEEEGDGGDGESDRDR